MNKKISIYLMLLLLVLGSCTGIKRLQRQSAVQKIETNNYESRDSSRITLYSGKQDYASEHRAVSIEIVPDGMVAYHTEKGFIGKAKQIKVYQSRLQTSQSKDTLSRAMSKVSKGIAQQQIQYQSKAKEMITKTTSKKWWFRLLGCALLVGLIWFAYRKFVHS